MSNVNIKQVEGGEVTTLNDADGVEIDTGTTSVWIQITNLVQQILKRITGLTGNTTPAITDELVLVDDPAGTPTAQKITLANFFKVINGLTADTAPDIAADYLVEYDASATAAKKLLLADVAALVNFTPGGRLTLTSGTPVTTSDVTGATSVYYTPYLHNKIQLWDGTRWVATTFTEQTLALGTITSGLPYDVFGYLSSGALAIEKLAWTNGTTRATAITLQDGRYCKSGDKTRLYLGTFYTTSTTQTEDSGGGTHQSGGKRFLWNMYNRVMRPLAVIDTTDTWSYTTDTVRQANGAAGNKVEFILGLSEDHVDARSLSLVYLGGNTRSAKAGLGLDSTTAFSGLVGDAILVGAGVNVRGQILGLYKGLPAVGYHYLAWLEKGADGTSTFVGDDGVAAGAGPQTGLQATVFA